MHLGRTTLLHKLVDYGPIVLLIQISVGWIRQYWLREVPLAFRQFSSFYWNCWNIIIVTNINWLCGDLYRRYWSQWRSKVIRYPRLFIFSSVYLLLFNYDCLLIFLFVRPSRQSGISSSTGRINFRFFFNFLLIFWLLCFYGIYPCFRCLYDSCFRFFGLLLFWFHWNWDSLGFSHLYKSFFRFLSTFLLDCICKCYSLSFWYLSRPYIILFNAFFLFWLFLRCWSFAFQALLEFLFYLFCVLLLSWSHRSRSLSVSLLYWLKLVFFLCRLFPGLYQSFLFLIVSLIFFLFDNILSWWWHLRSWWFLTAFRNLWIHQDNIGWGVKN